MYLGPYNKTSTPLGHRRACRMETPASARNPTSAQFLNAHIFHSFIHSFTHSFIHSFIHQFSSVQFTSFVRSIDFIHSFISSVQFSSFVRSFDSILSFMHACILSYKHSYICIYLCLHTYKSTSTYVYPC